MVVGFLADKIPFPARRGWGIYSYQLLRALLETDRENTYRCFYNIIRRERMAFVPDFALGNQQNRVWRVPGKVMELLWERWKILSAEHFLGPLDVLHVPYEFLPNVKRAKTVVTVHDVTFLKHPEHLSRSFVEMYSRRIWHIAERADRIITDSQNTRDELLAFTGISKHRVVPILLGVDSCFRPTDDPVRLSAVLGRYGVSSPYVLFVGAPDEDKNLGRLAEAFALVRGEFPSLQLVLAGKIGWGYSRLLEKLRERKLDGGVILTDYVPASDLPLLYAGAEILALPSIHEGFGLPVLEAMACGTAVLCSRVASLPEVVGDAGVLVDPYSTDEIAAGLRRLLVDEGLKDRCRRLGIERSRQFTWEATAARVRDVYREVIHG